MLNSGASCGGSSIHAAFEFQVTKSPKAVALSMDGAGMTYGELSEASSIVASQLAAEGIGRGSLVGVCVERSFDLVVAILGVLKAGAAYVPVDVVYPQDRVAFMVADAGIRVLVTQAALLDRFRPLGVTLLAVDGGGVRKDCSSMDGPLPATGADDLAYVIYTSGSTGRPKGVMVTHANVMRLFSATEPWFGFTNTDVWTLFHSAAFDFSVWELWGALLYGGKLVIVPFGISRSPEQFYRLLCEEAVTVLNQTPSAFRQLSAAEGSVGASSRLALRYVVFGGEALDMRSLEPWFERHGDQRPQMVNMYGITETTVHVTYRPLTRGDVTSRSVIGRPIPDLRVYVLDDSLQPVREGEVGEIHVAGAGVALGYLNRPELTEQRFIPDMFAPESGGRLYKSGDLARQLPGGDLEFVGRKDQQVKISGFRVELGEVEAVLRGVGGVRESIVVAKPTPAGQQRMVAYLILHDAAQLTGASVRSQLRAKLPQYMIPSVFVAISNLPLTPNGKLDTASLPDPEEDFLPNAPQSREVLDGLAGRVLDVWRETLGRRSIGEDDSFFDVGGNSILLAEIHVRLERLLGRSFPITDLFAFPTIRGFVARWNGEESPGRQAMAAARGSRQREVRSAMRRNRIRTV